MVPASRSIAEIQDALVKHSATGVLYKYEQGTGRIEALQFVLRIKHKDVAFSLPVPDIPLRSRLGPVRRSCTRTLRIIVSPRKLTTMPPLHHRVRERCHDSSSCLLPAGDPGMSVALYHAALRLAQPSHRVTPKAT